MIGLINSSLLERIKKGFDQVQLEYEVIEFDEKLLEYVSNKNYDAFYWVDFFKEEDLRAYDTEWLFSEVSRMTQKRFFPSPHTLSIGNNKRRQTSLFNLHNIPTPKTYKFHSREEAEAFLEVVKLPIVAKIITTDRGHGVYLIKKKADIKDYFEDPKVVDFYYFQEYIENDSSCLKHTPEVSRQTQ